MTVTTNSLADNLNKTFAEIEKRLAETFTSTATVPLAAGAFPSNIEREGKIGFGKVANEWRLFFERADGGRSPLTNCSIEIRIAAADALITLHRALWDAQQAQQAQLLRANETAGAFARMLDDWQEGKAT